MMLSQTRVRHLLLASPEPYDALVKTSVFDATMKELATTDNEVAEYLAGGH